MTPVKLRRATTADVPVLAGVDAQLVAGSDRWNQVLDLIESGRGFCLVAEAAESGERTGYVVAARTAFFGRDFIDLLVVGESWRRRGVGLVLMEGAMLECETESVFTSTNESNEPMRELLGRSGWSISGVLDGLDEGDPEVVYHRARPTR